MRNALDLAHLTADYTEGDPFVRLQLRPLYAKLQDSTVEDWDAFTECPTWLTLFRDGTVVLSVVVPQLAHLNTDGLVRLSTASLQVAGEVRVADEFVTAYARAAGSTVEAIAGERSNVEREGTYWWDLEPDEGRLDSAARLYIESIGHTINGFRHWLCYTTLICASLCGCDA